MSIPEPEEIQQPSMVEIDGQEVDVDQITAWATEECDGEGSISVRLADDEVLEERGDPTVLEERLRTALDPTPAEETS